MIKELAARWTREPQCTKLRVLKIDRPRRIDRVIDYFGAALGPPTVSIRGRLVAGPRRTDDEPDRP